MLTSKIGDSIINCFDGKYDRYRLKQWSSKGILKCPVCIGDYEYCHGEIVPPYFRHVGKECDGYYSESETEEHRQGKKLLYNWIKNQEGVINCQLEAWISETKQRPDIYFEHNGKRYVIEFQCTPIASEYLIRRELYKLNNINDIWVLGINKYNIEMNKEGNARHFDRFRSIEKDSMTKGLIYFDSTNEKFLFHASFMEKKHNLFKSLKERNSLMSHYKELGAISENVSSYNDLLFTCELSDSDFRKGGIYLIDDTYSKFNQLENEVLVMRDKELKELREREKIKEEKEKERILKIENFIESMNIKFNIDSSDYELYIEKTRSPYYEYSIGFMQKYVFFIKNNEVDFCLKYNSSRPITNKRNKLQWISNTKHENIKNVSIENIGDDDISEFIYSNINGIINPIKEKLKSLEDVLDLNIKIIDTGYTVKDSIRFRYLKEHNFYSLDYVTSEFAKEIRKLRKKEVVFMLRGKNEADYYIKRLKDIYGFKNVEKLKNCVEK